MKKLDTLGRRVCSYRLDWLWQSGIDRLKPIFQIIAVCCLGLVPRLQAQEATATQLKPSGLNPTPVDRAHLVAAAKAQEISNSKILERAWGYYEKWHGAWQSGHAKPTSADRQEVIAFTTSLLAQLEQLAKAENLGKQKNDVTLQQVVIVGSPEFKEAVQSEGTQTLKSLVIMGLVEHELDIHHDGVRDGVAIAYLVLRKLMARTPLDSDIYLLYARLSIDAKENTTAWQAARAGIFLRPTPSDADFEFVAFVGSVAAKDQWPSIQIMFREVAADPGQAEAAIKRTAVLFSGKMKYQNTPSK